MATNKYIQFSFAAVDDLAVRLNSLVAIAGCVMAVTLLSTLAYFGAKQHYRASVELSAQDRLKLLSHTLRSTIDRYRAVPEIISHSREVAGLSEGSQNATRINEANVFLEHMNKTVGAAAIYVLDAKGIAIASSNWSEPGSFVGHDYSFRPYYNQTMSLGRGAFYGVGVTTHTPGFFMAWAVFVNGALQGVTVQKIDLSALEKNWAEADQTVVLSDQDGVVFLASQPDLKYRPLRILTLEQRKSIESEQRYADVNIGAPLLEGRHKIADDVLTFSAAIDGTPWTLTLFQSTRDEEGRASVVAGLTALTSAVLVLFGILLHMRSSARRTERLAKRQLEKRVNERTFELRLARDTLSAEIEERRRIGHELYRTRDELVQAAKLAAMGQAFTKMTHELNQPLTALRTYLQSTRILIERKHIDAVSSNLDVMTGAVDRMAALTADLKQVARKSDGRFEEADVVAITKHVADLLKFHVRDSGAELVVDGDERAPLILEPARIEQVIMNLILNAVDAVHGCEVRRIEVFIVKQDRGVTVSVADTGPGVAPADRQRLFEPFFTTKEPGKGLGLGLAISFSIIREHRGTIAYEPRAEGGSVFKIFLPQLTADQLKEFARDDL